MDRTADGPGDLLCRYAAQLGDDEVQASALMEIIVELVIQLFVEVLGEALFEAGFEGAGKALRSRVGRYVIAAFVGSGAGFAWGLHVANVGVSSTPQSFWVSLVLAGASAVGAVVQQVRQQPDRPGLQSILTWPWRWPAHRFYGFTVINIAIAVGILTGFHVGR